MPFNFANLNDMQARATQGSRGVNDTFWNWLTGTTGQNALAEADFERQKEFFEEYQSMPALVEQYRQAGLNPNLLGGQTPSNPPSSSAPSVTPPLDVAKEVSSAVLGGVAAKQNERQLENDIDVSQFGKCLTEALAYQAFMSGGYNSELAMGAAISNYWANDQNIADLAIKKQNRANMQKEWDLIHANTDYVKKQLSRYDEMIDAELDLKAKQVLESQKHSFQMEEATNQIKLENDFFEKWNYHSGDPIEVGLRNRWQAGDFDQYDTMLDFCLNYGYQASLSENVAREFSSRFGKISISEFPAELARKIDEWAFKFDKKHAKEAEEFTYDLRQFGGLLKTLFNPDANSASPVNSTTNH